MFSILGFLSLAVLSGVVFGVRVIRTRADHATLLSPRLIILQCAFGIWSFALAIFSMSRQLDLDAVFWGNGEQPLNLLLRWR